jgi:ribosomal protein S18 acetylase RimI-like enzyme
MAAVVVRAYEPETDESWAVGLLDEVLGGRLQARRGEVVDALSVPGLVATDASGRLGLLTYQRSATECELVAIAASRRNDGVGTALLDALRLKVADCRRIWLTTTNDNLDAMRFYQRRGFALRALHAGAVDDARRRLKPAIPTTGAYGIPLRDELQLELTLTGGGRPSVIRRT